MSALEEVRERATGFRPSFEPKQVDELVAIVEARDRKISRLEQELETERRENSRLRERLDRVGANG